MVTREDLCDVVKEIYGDIDKFLTDVESDCMCRFNVFCTINDTPSDSDILILDNNTNCFISWYKLYHLGRDFHTNIESRWDLKSFIEQFKMCNEQGGVESD